LDESLSPLHVWLDRLDLVRLLHHSLRAYVTAYVTPLDAPPSTSVPSRAVALRVLLVEDSSAMRAFVRAALEEDGTAEVVEAQSGFEALRLLPREKFDIVITDINMPDINGLELIAFMRNSPHHRSTPCVIISTEAAKRDRDRAMALGANAYLTKPFDPSALREAVQKLLPRESGSDQGDSGDGG